GQFLQQNVSEGDIVVAPQIVDLLAYYFRDIYTHARDINILQDLNDGRVSGRKIYIVRSRFMSADDIKLLNQACNRDPNYKTVSLRRVQIVEISAPTDTAQNATASPDLQGMHRASSVKE